MAAGWFASLARRLELPEDVALGLPLVHLTGRYRARVENHRGITEYSPELIRIATQDGTVVLRGRGMLVKELERDDMVCVGHILAVELYPPDGR